MIKLYDLYPYNKEFDAKIVDVVRLSDNNYVLELDQTLFFPNEGGQSPDKGYIDACYVYDVIIKSNIVYHYISSSAFDLKIGDSVHGKIDWEHRFSNMQHHSAEHIFSGLVNRKFGYNNCGFHLGDNIVTMDYDGVLTKEDINQLELEVNMAIYENKPSRAFFPNKYELNEICFRSKIDNIDGLRLVEFSDYDICACCAPHVAFTGEIGIFKVISASNYKKGVRISYLAGKRAFLAIREESTLLNSIYCNISANKDNVEDFIQKLKNNKEKLHLKLVDMQTNYLNWQIAKEDKCKNIIILFNEDIDIANLRKLANIFIKDYSGILVYFCGTENDGYKYLVVSQNYNVKALTLLLNKELHGKGGGDTRLAQGTIQSKYECILSFFDKIEKNILTFKN